MASKGPEETKSAAAAGSSSDSSTKVVFGIAKTVEEKLELITRNLDEVMGDDVAKANLKTLLEKRDMKVCTHAAQRSAASERASAHTTSVFVVPNESAGAPRTPSTERSRCHAPEWPRMDDRIRASVARP